jgi:hypothetical protein
MKENLLHLKSCVLSLPLYISAFEGGNVNLNSSTASGMSGRGSYQNAQSDYGNAIRHDRNLAGRFPLSFPVGLPADCHLLCGCEIAGIHNVEVNSAGQLLAFFISSVPVCRFLYTQVCSRQLLAQVKGPDKLSG